MRFIIGLGIALLALAALPLLMMFSVIFLEERRSFGSTGLLLALLALTIAYIEFAAPAPLSSPAAKGQQKAIEALLPALYQLLTLGLFGSMLDRGVHFRACYLSWLLYLPGAFIIFVRRRKAPTTGDLIYLKWAAVPMVVFGMPLFMYIFHGDWTNWTCVRMILRRFF
jgi:hypothetical protein